MPINIFHKIKVRKFTVVNDRRKSNYKRVGLDVGARVWVDVSVGAGQL